MAESTTLIVEEDVAKIGSARLPWEKLEDTSVLITGASGMIPMYCTKVLLHLNDTYDFKVRVKALVRERERADKVFGDALNRRDLDLIVADVTHPDLDLGRFDHVIHGASAARPSEHSRNPVATIRANVIGTDNLLSWHGQNATPGAFLLMSSSEVYGSQPPGTASISEDSYGGIDLLAPRSTYSEGKRAAETLVAVYAHQYGFDYRNLRFGHIYGPGMRLDDGRVQADFARDALQGKDITLLSSGSAVRTYTYVADAVAGLFFAWLAGSNGAYNVADPQGKVSIRDLAFAFGAAAEPPVNVSYQEDKGSNSSFNPELLLALDSAKLHQTGWSPRVNLAAGTRRVVQHLREVHSKPPRDL